MSEKTLLGFFLEFTDALVEQLESDQKRWGDTWKHRPVEAKGVDPFGRPWRHQVDRGYDRFVDYYNQWEYADTPIPWLKIAGESLIAWVRENHPEELV